MAPPKEVPETEDKLRLGFPSPPLSVGTSAIDGEVEELSLETKAAGEEEEKERRVNNGTSSSACSEILEVINGELGDFLKEDMVEEELGRGGDDGKEEKKAEEGKENRDENATSSLSTLSDALEVADREIGEDVKEEVVEEELEGGGDGGKEEEKAEGKEKRDDNCTSSRILSDVLKVVNGEIGEDVKGGMIEEDLEVGGSGGKEEEKMKVPLYPVRPGKSDCAYYKKTGTCAYGAKCIFNHPLRNGGNSSEFGRKIEFQSSNDVAAVNGALGKLSLNEKKEEKALPCSSEVVKVVNFDGQDDWKEKKVVEKAWDIDEMKGQWKGDLNADNGWMSSKDEEGTVNTVVFYPQRSGNVDCAYYMKNGTCAYGVNCKFNHPPRTVGVQVVDKIGCEGHLEAGLTECKYYLLPGGCKFGKACKYSHSHEKPEEQPAMLNFLGLPMRPGEKECPYYMRTGACKFSLSCWYNHPNPTEVNCQNPVSDHQNDGSFRQHIWISSVPPSSFFQQTQNESASFLPASPSSFMPNMLFPPKRHDPNPKFDYHQLQVEFPERPGQPECPYFMKTGDCKFKSACKFHHPRSRLPKTPTCSLTSRGLPLRPDQPICGFYSRFGICKYGPACRFNHPIDFSSSVSSAARSLAETIPGNARAEGIRMEDSKTSVEQSA